MDSGRQITVGKRPNDFHPYPDNWQLRTLGEITISSQYGISSSSGGNYSVPILKMNNLQDGHIDLRELDYIQLSKAEMESLILNKGDLLINRTNSPDLVGKAAIYDLAGEHVFASYLVRFRLGPSVFPAFINFFLNSEPGQHKLKLLATKAVSQANINPSILKRRLFVPVPPLSEQTAIAAVLSDTDLLITSLDKLIVKKRDIKQATMQQLLTGKMRLLGFSGEWKVKKVGEIAEIGMGRTPSRRNQNYWGRGYKWLSIADLKSKHILETKEEITAIAASDMTVIPKGTLVMSFKLTIGKLAFTGCDMYSNEAICSFSNLRADAEYLYYILGQTDFSLYGKQAVKGYTLNTDSLNSVQILYPPLPEQQALLPYSPIWTLKSPRWNKSATRLAP
jgi:type I restriction enzyme, S subunit